jgi:DNA-binding transcriptional LysR family regulator
MNRLEAMSTLLAAIDAGSLSAASRRMRVPLATVSRRVSDLEGHLRAQLLVRTSRRLELTDAGRAYVHAIRDILTSVDEAERAAAGEFAQPRGNIAVTAPIVFGRLHVLPVVIAFLKAHPEINVRLMLTDRVTNFAEDQVDVALRIGALADSALIAARLGSVRRVVCASPAYLSAHAPTPKHPGDLKGHGCITFEGLTSPTQWTFGSGKARVSAPVHSRLVVNTAEAAIDAAAAGLGITRVLSYQIEAAVRQRKLTTILTDFEPEPAPVSLVYPGQGALALKTRAFLDYATDRLRASLASAGRDER